MMVKFKWHRVTQFLTVSFIAAGVGVMTYLEEVTFINQLCALVTSAFMMWGIFYFIQLLPHIGHYVIIIQSMIGDILHFQLLFWLMFAPFPFTFYMVVHSGLDCSSSNEFGDFVRMTHDSFLILLNLFDMSHYMNNVDSPWLLAAVHILFVLISAIMMLNFLISLLSNSVSKIAKHSHIIMSLQCLSVIFSMESRCFKLLRNYYIKQMKACRFVICQDDKIYLQAIENIYDVNRCVDNYAESINKREITSLNQYVNLSRDLKDCPYIDDYYSAKDKCTIVEACPNNSRLNFM